MFDSLWPHGLQHARFSCPSPAPRAYSNSCPSIQWCHTTISFSVVPFSSCLQSFPASGSSPMSQFFTSGGQSIGVSALASVLPMNTQDWSPLGWTGWMSLQSKGLSRVFSSTPVRKHQFFCAQPSLWSRSHIGTWLLEKSQLWLYRPLLPFLLFFPLLFHFTQNYFRDLIRHQCTEAKILASVSTKFISSRTFLDHPQ